MRLGEKGLGGMKNKEFVRTKTPDSLLIVYQGNIH